MNRNAKPGFVLSAAIVVGLLLGIVLLLQTVATYYYVAGALVRQEAQRDADRTASGLSRAVRLSGANDSAGLTPVVNELRHERPQRVAWIRIIGANGSVLAVSGTPVGALVTPAGRGYVPQNRLTLTAVREAEGGRVLVTAYPLVLRSTGGSVPAPATSEIAIYLSGISVSFRGLRQNAVVGCAAALALLAAVLIIGLRFPAYLRGKQYEEELELARRVQSDLLPSRTVLSGGVDLAAKCIPARHVGGDLYDVFEAGQDRVALVLGDVSGKGMPAALLMALIHGAIRSNDWISSPENHEESTARLNHLLFEKSGQERFASLFWCYYDARKSVLHYINAGHLPPLLVRQSGPGSFEVHRLEEGGMVLGVRADARYHQHEVAVEAGDLLVIFSDGIPEAANAKDEEFGEHRLIAAVEENWDSPSGKIRDAILAGVRAFLRRQSPQDDRTLMVVRLQPVGRPQTPPRAETEPASSLETVQG